MTGTGTPRGSAGAHDADAATRAHFAARATTYAAGGEESVQAMLELAAPKAGERVLDVATGTGLVLFALASHVGPHGLAAGVDFTPAMLAEAVRQRTSVAGAHLTAPAFIAAHAVHLPFVPRSFDIITCRFSVHHFSDPVGSLAAMAAALRPGGRLVIADFVRPQDSDQAATHGRLERLRGHEYVEIYDRSRLESMLAEVGCPVVSARTVRRELRPQDWLGSPNMAAEARQPLLDLIDELGRRGSSEAGADASAGLEVRQVNGELRFIRSDVVLLGVSATPAEPAGNKPQAESEYGRNRSVGREGSETIGRPSLEGIGPHTRRRAI